MYHCDCVVIGAGVIGVLTAWALHERGFSVCLIERTPGPAQQTSAANAGVIAPGYVSPFAAPGAARKAFFNLFEPDRAFFWSPSLDARQWRWLLRWIAESNHDKYQRNREAMFALAAYSQARLREISEKLGLAYRSVGRYFVVYRSLGDFKRSATLRQQLTRAGLDHHIHTPGELFALEPSLCNSRLPIYAALQVSGDEAGDCQAFVEALWKRLLDAGMKWLASRSVDSVAPGKNPYIECVLDDHSRVHALHVVIAAGPWSSSLTGGYLKRLPLYPIRGFSLTWDEEMLSQDTASSLRGLTGALMDERYKIAITPLHAEQSRLRVAGMAMLGPPSASQTIGLAHQRAAAASLWRIASQWFGNLPQACQPPAKHPTDRFTSVSRPAGPRLWIGSRPMLPDGLPLIGRLNPASDGSSIWINSGHGSTGWAMAAGSACLLADQISGEHRAVMSSIHSSSEKLMGCSPDAFSPQRWR